MYSIKPADLVKFDSTDFMPVPLNWGDNAADAAVKNNAVDGGIKIVVVKNRGTGIGTANQTYTRVPIKGDGFNAECTVVVNNDAQIESVTYLMKDLDILMVTLIYCWICSNTYISTNS